MVFYANPKNDMVVHVEHQSLGNTKISRNDIYNKSSAKTKRCKNLPKGQMIGIPEIYQKMLGQSDVEHNFDWGHIDTGPMETRSKTKVCLDSRGNVRMDEEESDFGDAVVLVSDCYTCRADTLKDRQFTDHQKLLLQGAELKYVQQDKVSVFGIRPVELLQLIRGVKHYFEWFHICDKVMSCDAIKEALNADVLKCMWIDGMGRRVMMRKSALSDIKWHLLSVSNSRLARHSLELKYALIHMINCGHERMESLFVFNDRKADYPIAVFSKIVPEQTSKFILHILLIMGEYDTELDLKNAGTIENIFLKAGLIRKESIDNRSAMEADIVLLMQRLINEVVPYQPLTERRLDSFIVKAYELLHCTLVEKSVPLNEYPPCLATELQKLKENEFKEQWYLLMKDQLTSINNTLVGVDSIPSIEQSLNASKDNPFQWDPIKIMSRSNEQCEDSFTEQQFALNIAIRAIDRYKYGFCGNSTTKGVLNNGAPGAGKTFILQVAALYAKCQGLNFICSSLCAHRSKTLGGINMHQLFQIPVNNSNIFRKAQVRHSSDV